MSVSIWTTTFYNEGHDYCHVSHWREYHQSCQPPHPRDPIFNKYLGKNSTGVILKPEVALYIGSSPILAPVTLRTLRYGCCAEAIQADCRTAGHRRVEGTTTGINVLSAAAVSNASPALPIFICLAPPPTKDHFVTALSRADHCAVATAAFCWVSRRIALLAPCRFPIVRIRCTVRLDGCIVNRPRCQNAGQVNIIAEIRTGKLPRKHGTLMGFAPLAASGVSALRAAAASATVSPPMTMSGGTGKRGRHRLRKVRRMIWRRVAHKDVAQDLIKHVGVQSALADARRPGHTRSV